MSWRTVKLAELVENFSVRAKDVGGAEGLDFYGVSNEDGIIKTKYAAEDKAEDYKIIEKGCFAYNPYRVNVGSIGLVSDDTRGLISPAYVIFKPKPKSIIPELLFKFLKSAEGLRQIIFYARGTVRQALRFEDLCNIEISIPDYSEQQGLYNKLINSQKSSNILDAELKNQLELLKKLRQQLLQDAVQGKLVEQNKKDETASDLLRKIKDEKQKLIAEKKLKKEKELLPIKPEEIPFEIPENWVWCRLNDICEAIIDCPHSTPHYIENETGYYGIDTNCINEKGEITRLRSLSFESYQERIRRLVPKENDIIYAREGSIGLATFIPKDKNICLGQRVMLFRASKAIIHSYLIYAVTDVGYKNRLLAKHRGMGAKHVNVKDIVESLIALPPLAEQNRIVQKIDELMQYCNELETTIKQSESQNEKLLQQVLREALRKEPVGV